jgi:LemA protein
MLALIGMAIYVQGVYIQLVQAKTDIDQTWSKIKQLEKQRCEETSSLTKICEIHVKHEHDIIEKTVSSSTKVAEAKAPVQMARASSSLTGALKSLFSVSENYPELKTNANFTQIQQHISNLESELSAQIKLYNDSVNLFNTRIKQAPAKHVASLMKHSDQEMYDAPETDETSSETGFGKSA